MVRRDLQLSKGKLSVQVAHASLEAYRRTDPRVRKDWEREGSKKVVVETQDLKSLMELKKKAGLLGLPLALIRDAGRTEVSPGTVTTLGLGPAQEGLLNRVTGSLKTL